jgi:hypothetical protein
VTQGEAKSGARALGVGQNLSERRKKMNNYEVSDVFEVGQAGSLIQDKERITEDEVAGLQGPFEADTDSD